MPVAALAFTGDKLNMSSPTVIWESDVPNKFDVCTVLLTGEDERPYIVCLDPSYGNITVFDPLTGSIRAQSNVELSDWDWENTTQSSTSFAEFLDSPAEGNLVFIHDPAVNEIIELEISVRSIS